MGEKIVLSEEKDKETIEAWKSEADACKTTEEMKKFIDHLIEDYAHDYGTIVHAIHAAMRAAFSAVNNSPQGGITSFQGGCLMWAAIKWLGFTGDSPLRLLQFKNMLYPQHAPDFEKVVSRRAWEWIQGEAKKLLEEREGASPTVVAHWESIRDGVVPFGYQARTGQM
jgi:hypothetical protein